MIKVLNSTDWLKSYANAEWFSIFHHPDFLAVHANVYEVKPIHFVYELKGEVLFAVSSFEKNNCLVVPNHFLRTGFWINKSVGEIQILHHLQQMLNQLKERYKRIRFNLPVGIDDVRAFSWCGFTYKLMHTNEKDLRLNFNYHENIFRMLKKPDPGFSFNVCGEHFEKSLTLHKADFYKFGIRKKHVEKYMPLLTQLKNTGYLIDLTLSIDDEVVASNFVLLNKEEGKAYVVLIAKSERWYQYGTHAKIYDFTFHYLKDKGYKVVDLFGADVPGFALFKLKFSVKLKHHYQVSYDRSQNMKQVIRDRIKSFLKKYIA